MLKNKRFFSSLLETPKLSIAIFVCYEDLATSFNALNQTKRCILISQEYLIGWKKKRNKCHKTKLGNRWLVLNGKKNENWPHFKCWAHCKKLLLTLLLKKNIQRWCTFWGSYFQRMQFNIILRYLNLHLTFGRVGFCKVAFSVVSFAG